MQKKPSFQVTPSIPHSTRPMFPNPRNLMSPHNSNSLATSFSQKQTTTVFRYLTCVFTKKSNRKHKKWEGDALLKVGTRSVILIDMEGKEI